MTSQEILIKLLGIALCGRPVERFPEDADWREVLSLAKEMEVTTIALDGLQICLEADPSIESEEIREVKIELFKTVVSIEMTNTLVQDTAEKLSAYFRKNGVDLWILKGIAYARRYPVPEHRGTSDLDIYLGPNYEKGNLLIEKKGAKVDRSQYKHSEFRIGKVCVENHQFFTAIRGNSANKQIERELRARLAEASEASGASGASGASEASANGYKLPSWAFDALFFMYHSRAHLLTVDGISLRFVCDWVILRRTSPDINTFRIECRDLGFGKFLSAIDELADCIEHGKALSELSAPAAYLLHDMRHRQRRKQSGSLKTYFEMIGRFLSEGKKFRLFSDISSLRIIWIYVTGFIFDRHPSC